MSEHEDLNWLAFRYVAGELNAAELQAFESQLEDDQSAREAVATACELTSCIATAEHLRSESAKNIPSLAAPIAPVARPSSPWQHVSVLAVSLAVCLLLLLTTIRLPQPDNGGQVVVQPVAEPAVALQLAEIWSATHQPLDDPLWPPEQPDDDDFDVPVALADLSPDDGATYWIETAVFGLAAEQ
jgi:anti-sigma-K factor RskA